MLAARQPIVPFISDHCNAQDRVPDHSGWRSHPSPWLASIDVSNLNLRPWYICTALLSCCVYRVSILRCRALAPSPHSLSWPAESSGTHCPRHTKT
jgi:hypothetical protein